MTAQENFQQLLRDLFQFDSADLDFGIYRIMNHKRAVIERFITEDLPQAIQEELKKGALAKIQQAQQTLEEARQRVLDALDEDAIDAEGNLAQQYHHTKVGADKVYVNGDSFIPSAQPLDGVFKARMFAGVEV